jgi:hypothetical protein
MRRVCAGVIRAFVSAGASKAHYRLADYRNKGKDIFALRVF